ncbi:MAG: sulfite exporter TauE/SafE family protein [Alphaproteobacteria bacterium]|nr:sulfite exporter TauE/SafE family protein [Alphaproteobacteria bacterium]
MSASLLLCLGLLSGGAAGILAGLIGIGGGIVIVPVLYYGLQSAGISPDQAAHIAVSTSLAAILPAAVVSSIGHWRAGHMDFGFLREWGPGVVCGVIMAQLAAPHLNGKLMTGAFGLFCLLVAVRFGLPSKFRPWAEQPPGGGFCHVAGLSIGLVSGLAGVGGGIMTNIVMTFSGMPMHRSIGRAAAIGVVVSAPAVLVAFYESSTPHAGRIGDVDLCIWACIAPMQAIAAWFGSQLSSRIKAESLSLLFASALAVTGMVMLQSTIRH